MTPEYSFMVAPVVEQPAVDREPTESTPTRRYLDRIEELYRQWLPRVDFPHHGSAVAEVAGYRPAVLSLINDRGQFVTITAHPGEGVPAIDARLANGPRQLVWPVQEFSEGRAGRLVQRDYHFNDAGKLCCHLLELPGQAETAERPTAEAQKRLTDREFGTATGHNYWECSDSQIDLARGFLSGCRPA